jgi:hypothetical protein
LSGKDIRRGKESATTGRHRAGENEKGKMKKEKRKRKKEKVRRCLDTSR